MEKSEFVSFLLSRGYSNSGGHWIKNENMYYKGGNHRYITHKTGWHKERRLTGFDSFRRVTKLIKYDDTHINDNGKLTTK